MRNCSIFGMCFRVDCRSSIDLSDDRWTEAAKHNGTSSGAQTFLASHGHGFRRIRVQNRNRLSNLTWPPHIICLFIYLAFAGASALWAFSPDRSFVRYTQQLMVVTSIVLPATLTARTVDLMRSLFLCFACSLVLNLLFVLGGSVTIAQYGSKAVDIGYQGYFVGKNYLGECAAPALLLALDETRHRGRRRATGAIFAVLAIFLVSPERS